MNRYIPLALAATAAVALPAQADATVITFENLAVGTTLSNQYAALGVLFSPNAFSGAGSSTSGQPWATNTDMTIVSSTGTDVGGLGTPALVSGNILRSFNNWLNEDGDPSFLITFTTAINAFSIDFAGVATPADTRIFAYNGSTLLGTVAGTVTTGQFRLGFNAASITSIRVAPGSYNDWVGVDNVNFTQVAATVPEPATWAMMLVGFAMTGATLRYRRRKTTIAYG